MIKRIHINQHIIRANKKNGTDDPPITIKEGKRNWKANSVHILGPSVLIYDSEHPLKCGAKCWIETKSNIITIGPPLPLVI